jgi:hypothetical protein
MLIRNKTSPEYIYHDLYLYFSGLSLRRTSQKLFVLSNETMFLSGTGFKNSNHKRYHLKAKRLMNLS